MPDNEAEKNPEAFVSDEEMEQAYDPSVGEGTPETAPDKLPKTTTMDRIRAIIGR